ncbi:MAG: lamin tail domain-containing protein [Candidatus Cloacimonetes bacterium]|nr:lamin tail domain-containing protein [Candidatus Cloacimonadota bacterium]MCF7815331.1 lamin tail domain-containing protein [Candidatus Cloacimonadota bacterium]MCF7869117.1 lamin tail domain-containing protein [Candidatus Cloacimonadota bacterium]MCF7884546.1 lamin tail domain-containing protein [Candidatus Cloacimonadota bacterium]
MKKTVVFLVLLVFSFSLVWGQTSPISESFTNVPTSSSTSYSTREWTGDDGGTWNATDSRADQSITGLAICIRNGVLTSPNVSGGIGDLTLTTQRAFTGGTGNLTVKVNGSTVGTIPYDATEQTNSISNIDIAGSIVVTIETPGNGDRIIMDDLTWTAYVSTDPTISLSTSTLIGFTYEIGNGPSTEQSFTAQGTNLTANINITPPTNYEISTGSGGSFVDTNPITLNQSEGTVAETTIYVRLKAGLSIADYNNEDITASSTDADNKTVTCSGSVTEELPDIIISEIMQNPDGVLDDNGEWFEIYNAGSTTVNIDGWTISDNGSDNHVIDNGGTLNIDPGDFLVLGNDSNSLTNGNYTCDYEYTGITLSNSDDEIILMDGLTEVDRVEYDGGTNWPDPTGASMVFTGNSNTDNNTGSNWTTATLRQPSYVGTTGDLGSPGSNGDDQSLPVTLSSFSATIQNGTPELYWTTESELENMGWNIYRSEEETGMDNNNYLLLNGDMIPGMGTTSIPTDYSFIDDHPITTAGTYWYWLQSVSYSGELEMFGPISLLFEPGGNGNLPQITELSNNFPNPFNPTTTIKFSIEENETGKLTIYNVSGQKIVQKTYSAGNHIFNWNAEDQASGVYFYKLHTSRYNETRKMILMK